MFTFARAASAVCVLVASFPALAHVTLETRETKAGQSYRAVLRVPHGCDGKATNVLRVRIPQGMYSVKPMPKAGWTLSTTRAPLAKPENDHGRPVTEGVSEIVWRGGALADDQYDEFLFIGTVAPDVADGASLHFPVVQECEGASVAWNDTSGTRDAKQPAPALRIANAAGPATTKGLRIVQPWVRATPKGAPVAGGYVSVTNTGDAPDRLVGASLPLAAKGEIHEMATEGGMMKMRALPDGLEIKPGQTVELKPNGYHVMFMGLREPVVQGEPLKGTLIFEKAGAVPVTWTVAPIGAQAPSAAGAPAGEDHTHH